MAKSCGRDGTRPTRLWRTLVAFVEATTALSIKRWTKLQTPPVQGLKSAVQSCGGYGRGEPLKADKGGHDMQMQAPAQQRWQERVYAGAGEAHEPVWAGEDGAGKSMPLRRMSPSRPQDRNWIGMANGE